MLFAAKVWSFWLGVFVAAGGVLTMIAVVAGYLVKVVRPKYPPRSVRRP
ncbi:MAG: hypothetical protein HYX34_14185 [Actinobacteria bacterium]|nr:hypothetical protein [Actinomycetota bacterium]